MRVSRLAIAFLVAVIVASACGGSGGGSPSAAAKPNVTIGSTNFSEQLILGELYAQILEANGYTVTRKFNLGAREIVFPALASGQIDLEADYLATLLAFVNKNATGSTDPKATSTALQKELDAFKRGYAKDAETTVHHAGHEESEAMEDEEVHQEQIVKQKRG
jgi:osmoprotectant transport system substrate-binding protein